MRLEPERCRRAVLLLALAVAVAVAAGGEEAPIPEAYRPYAFLIGEWEVGIAGQPPASVTRFRWSPLKTHILYSGTMLVNGEEQPNWDGLMVWNGVRHDLDFLLVLDQSTGDLAQEQGRVSVAEDGTVTREITVYYSEGNALPPDWRTAAGAEGATARFRHTFQRVGPDRVHAAVVRKTAEGWVPSFPGSDSLVMVKRDR
jgi:hypothetical protein